MKKFVPYQKMSKKAQRERDHSQRTLWSISPVTRIKQGKIYDRKKLKNQLKKENFDGFS